MWFLPYQLLGHEKSLDASNYRVKVNAETCKACGLCMKRCPMDALQLKVSKKARNKFGKAAVVNTDLCIGCGVCVQKCPSDSLILELRETTTRPPKGPRDWVMSHFADRDAARAKIKGERQ